MKCARNGRKSNILAPPFNRIDTAIGITGNHESFGKLSSSVPLGQQSLFLTVRVCCLMHIEIIGQIRTRFLNGFIQARGYVDMKLAQHFSLSKIVAGFRQGTPVDLY